MSEIARIEGITYECYPKYMNTSFTDRAGIGIVMTQLAKQKLYFKELTTGDVGIDGIIEPAINESSTGLLIACQVKSSEDDFKEKAGSTYHNFNEGKLSHYEYWLKKSIPVVLILVDTKTNNCYWKHLTRTNIKKNKGSFSTQVPYSQKLDQKNTFDYFYEIAKNRTEDDSKFYYLRENIERIKEVNDDTIDVEILFVRKGIGEYDLTYMIDRTYGDTTYFKFDSKSSLIEAVKQYFFWADVETIGKNADEHLFQLSPNSIGRNFLELVNDLSTINLKFK